MRPYTIRGKYYYVNQSACAYACASLKPSRLAAGMMYTAARLRSRQGERSHDATTLMLYGTLDPLARTNRMKTYRRANFQQVTRWIKKS